MSDRPDTDDLVSRYPAHVPMGPPLPLPSKKPKRTRKRDDDRPDAEYSL